MWEVFTCRPSKDSVKAKFSLAPLHTAQDRQRGSEKRGRPAKRGKEERGPPKRCDTYIYTTAKRVPPLPSDHNLLYQVAISISQSLLSPGPNSPGPPTGYSCSKGYYVPQQGMNPEAFLDLWGKPKAALHEGMREERGQ
jgi:hypothetical protein